MIAALDSSLCRPTPAQADAARAAGVRVWCGYLTTRPNVGIYGGSWSPADFENARRCGGWPIAFCSGWDDPIALRDLAAAWRVRLCLDVEDGIRPDGPWIEEEQWLIRSGAGLYGNFSVHYHTGEPIGRGAAFNIGAAYPGFDPAATWPSYLPRPPHACGWQVQGSHDEFGCEVDRSWLDDWFGSDGQINQEESMAAGSSIYVAGRLWLAAIGGDGQVRLKSSTGGLGGLYNDPWLAIDGPLGSTDAREVWFGRDLKGSIERVLLFCMDGSGDVYAQVLTDDAGEYAPAGWAGVTGFTGCRASMYEGQALPAGPQGLQGPPGPPGLASTVAPPHTHAVTASGTTGGPV